MMVSIVGIRKFGGLAHATLASGFPSRSLCTPTPYTLRMDVLAAVACVERSKREKEAALKRQLAAVRAYLVRHVVVGEQSERVVVDWLFEAFKMHTHQPSNRPSKPRFCAMVFALITGVPFVVPTPAPAPVSCITFPPGPSVRLALAASCGKEVAALFPGAITLEECTRFMTSSIDLTGLALVDKCVDRLHALGTEMMSILRHTLRTSHALVDRYFEQIDVATVLLQSARADMNGHGGIDINANTTSARSALAMVLLFVRPQFPSRTAVVSADFARDAVERRIARSHNCEVCVKNGVMAGLCLCFCFGFVTQHAISCDVGDKGVALGSPPLWATISSMFVGSSLTLSMSGVSWAKQLIVRGDERIDPVRMAHVFVDRWTSVLDRVRRANIDVDAFVTEAVTNVATSTKLTEEAMRTIPELLLRVPSGDRKCEMRRWGEMIEFLAKVPKGGMHMDVASLVHTGRMALEFALNSVLARDNEPTAAVFCAVGAAVEAIASLKHKGFDDATSRVWINAPDVVRRVREKASVVVGNIGSPPLTIRMWGVFVALTIPVDSVDALAAALWRVTREGADMRAVTMKMLEEVEVADVI